MTPQSEYFRRHNIQEPLIEYVKEGYLILKSDAPGANPNWHVLFIREVPNNGHPNHSELHELRPVYNGYETKPTQEVNIREMTFDTYFNTIQSVLERYHKTGNYLPVFGDINTKIALMEMFVYTWCGYISDHYGDKFISSFFDVLNKKRSMDEREKAFYKTEEIITTDRSGSTVKESWNNMKRYINPGLYCDWIKTWNVDQPVLS